MSCCTGNERQFLVHGLVFGMITAVASICWLGVVSGTRCWKWVFSHICSQLSLGNVSDDGTACPQFHKMVSYHATTKSSAARREISRQHIAIITYLLLLLLYFQPKNFLIFYMVSHSQYILKV
jgi:hypothetical protein